MNKQTDIKKLAKLRQNRTIPELSKYLGIGARKLERLLAKYKIRRK